MVLVVLPNFKTEPAPCVQPPAPVKAPEIVALVSLLMTVPEVIVAVTVENEVSELSIVSAVPAPELTVSVPPMVMVLLPVNSWPRAVLAMVIFVIATGELAVMVALAELNVTVPVSVTVPEVLVNPAVKISVAQAPVNVPPSTVIRPVNVLLPVLVWAVRVPRVISVVLLSVNAVAGVAVVVKFPRSTRVSWRWSGRKRLESSCRQ